MNTNAIQAFQRLSLHARLLRNQYFKQAKHKQSNMSQNSDIVIKTDVFRKMIEREEVSVLADIFQRHKYKLRIAGGAVRDFLHPSGNIMPHDIDFATDATPQQMKEMFEKENIRMINVEGGEKHGTITARILDKDNFEVTTLRIDKVTDGRKAEVEFTTDWKIDAERRDLTINSMFLDLEGRLYDYFGGRNDLLQERIAFVGNTVKRIQEDYLRILRYFRFYGRIVGEGDPKRLKNHDIETIKDIRTNCEGLGRISGERIWSEWKKILSGRFGDQLTETMILECGLGPYIGLPENPDVQSLKKVWISASKDGGITTEVQPPTLLAALLQTTEEMMALHSRLKLSGFERDMALFVISHRNSAEMKVVGGLKEKLKMYQCLYIDSKIKPKDVRKYIEEVMRYRGESELLEEWLQWEPPVFPVTGKDLIAHDCPKGRTFSMVLDILKRHWKESDFKLSKENLLELLPDAIDEITILQKERKNKKRSPSPHKNKI